MKNVSRRREDKKKVHDFGIRQTRLFGFHPPTDFFRYAVFNSRCASEPFGKWSRPGESVIQPGIECRENRT